MELTVVRGNATPEELEAVVRAVTRLVAEARHRAEEQSPWSEQVTLERGPLRGGWRVSGWAA